MKSSTNFGLGDLHEYGLALVFSLDRAISFDLRVGEHLLHFDTPRSRQVPTRWNELFSFALADAL
jgi:hypothetical protein